LKDLVDVAKESAKMKAEVEKLEKYAKSIEQKLSNEEFVKKAPAGMVAAEKAKIEETAKRVERLKLNLQQISAQ
jgi:valyl-tRNA synthetase